MLQASVARCAFYRADAESATLHHVTGMAEVSILRMSGTTAAPVRD
jgi:hypothetical protein